MHLVSSKNLFWIQEYPSCPGITLHQHRTNLIMPADYKFTRFSPQRGCAKCAFEMKKLT